MRLPRLEHSIKPPVVAPVLADIGADSQLLAARMIAAEFHLPINVAQLIASLAGIGTREAA